MTPVLQEKLDRLRSILKDLGSVIVAYSGGVDSALVMAVAHQVLGSRALACIGISPSYPERELRDAIELAQRLGIPYRTVSTTEHLDPSYAANPDNRCFYCKTDLYSHLADLAAAEGFAAVVDGNNASDLGDDRPGMTAARQRGVRSPLLEARISKPEVRALSRHLHLPVWDKPAMACLSSRIPHGTQITPTLLRQIEKAEDALVDLGFRQFRVRHHGTVARIELPLDDLPRALEVREHIIDGILRAGYQYATLDLAGFRREPAPDDGQMFVQLTTGRP